MNFDEIAEQWEQESKVYNELGRKLVSFIRKEISNYEILPEVTYRTKDLISIIKKIKKKEVERKDYSLVDLKDKLGLRIICSFSTDLEIVDKFIRNNFLIEKADYKKDILDYDKLDYTSNHYDLKIDFNNKKLNFKTDKYQNSVFEVQVRSINQHAWSNTAHTLTYKRESNISDVLKRRVYRLLSLYEIADDEFSAVNNALLSQEDNILYTLLRKLEGKIYKYAKIDFDREISLYYLTTILKGLSGVQIEKINQQIIPFIEKNEKKIVNIFNSNQSRFFKIPFITQPEVFLVWFGLENFPFAIEEIYANDLDEDELEQIKSLW